MAKTSETSGFTEVEPQAADELLKMAKTIRSPEERASWLEAYRKYRFSRATKKTQRKLARIAELYRRLELRYNN